MQDLKRVPLAAAAAAVAVAGALVMTLSACMTAGPPPPPWQDKLAASGWTLGPQVPTVVDFSFDGYEALDDEHVVVHVGTTRRVLVTAAPGCVGLASALRIGYTGSTHALSRMDRLLVNAPGQLPSHCWVEAIHQLQPPKG